MNGLRGIGLKEIDVTEINSFSIFCIVLFAQVAELLFVTFYKTFQIELNLDLLFFKISRFISYCLGRFIISGQEIDIKKGLIKSRYDII